MPDTFLPIERVDVSAVSDAIGLTITAGGNRYVAVVQHGNDITWRSACGVCGEPFELVLPRSTFRPTTRHCAQHRRRGRIPAGHEAHA